MYSREIVRRLIVLVTSYALSFFAINSLGYYIPILAPISLPTATALLVLNEIVTHFAIKQLKSSETNVSEFTMQLQLNVVPHASFPKLISA